MTSPLPEPLEIILAGALSGFIHGLFGLSWSSITLKTLIMSGVSPGQGLSICSLSNVLLEVGGKIYPVGNSGERVYARDATISGLKLLTSLLVNAAAIGCLSTGYVKYLVAALNLILASLLATNWNPEGGDVSPPSHSSFSIGLRGRGRLLNPYPILIQCSKPFQLFAASLLKILVMELFVPLHEADVLYTLLLSTPALSALFIARKVRGKISEEMLGRMAAIAFALRGFTSLTQ